MKRLLPLFLVFILGCSGQDPNMDAALELRSRCLGAESLSFRVTVGADYITHIEEFTLDCTAGSDGAVRFRISEPEDISDIAGTVRGDRGTVEFDDTVLAFPLMADGRLSPLSGPWVVVKAIRSGNILAAGREGEKLHLTIDDSYEDKALAVDLWVENGAVREAEVAFEGRRCLTMTFDGFSA